MKPNIAYVVQHYISSYSHVGLHVHTTLLNRSTGSIISSQSVSRKTRGLGFGDRRDPSFALNKTMRDYCRGEMRGGSMEIGEAKSLKGHSHIREARRCRAADASARECNRVEIGQARRGGAARRR